MSTKKLQIIGKLDADTVDGKHASDFALAQDVKDIKMLIGDEDVADQIELAVSQKSQVQIITWEAGD